MPKLLLVERDGRVLPSPHRTRRARASDAVVRLKLTEHQFWRFVAEFCETLGVPGPLSSESGRRLAAGPPAASS